MRPCALIITTAYEKEAARATLSVGSPTGRGGRDDGADLHVEKLALARPGDQNKALMHFSREITAVSMDRVHDSVFEVPAGYTLRKLSGR